MHNSKISKKYDFITECQVKKHSNPVKKVIKKGIDKERNA
jgi:hypothetical protein